MLFGAAKKQNRIAWLVLVSYASSLASFPAWASPDSMTYDNDKFKPPEVTQSCDDICGVLVNDQTREHRGDSKGWGAAQSSVFADKLDPAKASSVAAGLAGLKGQDPDQWCANHGSPTSREKPNAEAGLTRLTQKGSDKEITCGTKVAMLTTDEGMSCSNYSDNLMRCNYKNDVQLYSQCYAYQKADDGKNWELLLFALDTATAASCGLVCASSTLVGGLAERACSFMACAAGIAELAASVLLATDPLQGAVQGIGGLVGVAGEGFGHPKYICGLGKGSSIKHDNLKFDYRNPVPPPSEIHPMMAAVMFAGGSKAFLLGVAANYVASVARAEEDCTPLLGKWKQASEKANTLRAKRFGLFKGTLKDPNSAKECPECVELAAQIITYEQQASDFQGQYTACAKRNEDEAAALKQNSAGGQEPAAGQDALAQATQNMNKVTGGGKDQSPKPTPVPASPPPPPPPQKTTAELDAELKAAEVASKKAKDDVKKAQDNVINHSDSTDEEFKKSQEKVAAAKEAQAAADAKLAAAKQSIKGDQPAPAPPVPAPAPPVPAPAPPVPAPDLKDVKKSLDDKFPESGKGTAAPPPIPGLEPDKPAPKIPGLGPDKAPPKIPGLEPEQPPAQPGSPPAQPGSPPAQPGSPPAQPPSTPDLKKNLDNAIAKKQQADADVDVAKTNYEKAARESKGDVFKDPDVVAAKKRLDEAKDNQGKANIDKVQAGAELDQAKVDEETKIREASKPKVESLPPPEDPCKGDSVCVERNKRLDSVADRQIKNNEDRMKQLDEDGKNTDGPVSSSAPSDAKRKALEAEESCLKTAADPKTCSVTPEKDPEVKASSGGTCDPMQKSCVDGTKAPAPACDPKNASCPSAPPPAETAEAKAKRDAEEKEKAKVDPNADKSPDQMTDEERSQRRTQACYTAMTFGFLAGVRYYNWHEHDKSKEQSCNSVKSLFDQGKKTFTGDTTPIPTNKETGGGDPSAATAGKAGNTSSKTGGNPNQTTSVKLQAKMEGYHKCRESGISAEVCEQMAGATDGGFLMRSGLDQQALPLASQMNFDDLEKQMRRGAGAGQAMSPYLGGLGELGAALAHLGQLGQDGASQILGTGILSSSATYSGGGGGGARGGSSASGASLGTGFSFGAARTTSSSGTMNFGAREDTTDIWHSKTSLNLFQIVSERIGKSSGRVK